MRVVWFLVCVLGARGAADLFDAELHRAALQPALCARQLAAMRRADFYDASFRAPEGMLVGNLGSWGNYHQCLAINQDFPDTNIQGKYCLIRAPLTPPTLRIPSLTGVSASENVTWTEVALPEDLMQAYAGKSLSLAVCVPKSCAVEAVLAPYTEHPVLGFNYTEQYCRLPHDKPFVAADYVAVVIFSVIGMLTLISTTYELRHIFILRRASSQASALLRVCSLYSNTRRLLTFDKPRALDCLDGIRSLSLLFIIIFHNFWENFLIAKNVANSFEVHQWLREKRAVWLVSSDIAVDTFFTLSGLLLVYTSVKKMKQASLLKNLHWFYLRRFLRLFPLLAIAVLLQASVVHRVADGPVWHVAAEQVGDCRRHWWSALLLVRNIATAVVPEIISSCGSHLWYLSVDMQLHVVSPLVLYWVLASRRAAWAALAAALLTSLAVTVAVCFTITYDFSISLVTQKEATGDIRDFLKYYYKNTVVRSPPFLIGMLLGYILHVFKGRKSTMSKWVLLTFHALSLAIFAYVVYIVHPCLQPGWDNHFIDSMNNSFRRPTWSLALCWMIFACAQGYGGPLNWFLSLRLWKFVARISYSMYLFHYYIQEIKVASAVSTVYFDMQTLFTSFASDVVYAVLFATAMCVIVEEPAFTLQKMFLKDYSEPRKQTEDKSQSAPAEQNEEKHNIEE